MNSLSVEAIFPAVGQDSVELFMAVWTPGSYLVREYSRHLDSIAAKDETGRDLALEKTRKNRWRVSTAGANEIHLHYRVYCHEMTVRSNWVEEEFALINGAPTFVALVDQLHQQHDLQFELPERWTRSLTGLPAASNGKPHHYTAPDYDTLVDSPVLLGNPAVYDFEVDGIPHCLVNEGEGGVWDGPKSSADVQRIVRHHRDLWGGLPYEKYVFLNLVTAGLAGGLEHKNSVCMMASRWATRTRKAYSQWLSLVSHEFFHVWNVKRLRPVELGPFDYENENYTQGLWVAEGFTDYYGDLAVKRAGLITQEEYLSGPLSEAIHNLQTTPGRLLQPLQLSSYDAWIKLYRPDENSVNTAMSYYTKGHVVAWLLDAKIRRSTNSAKTLDDLMRLAFQRFSGGRGYTQAEIMSAAEEVAGTSLRNFFHSYVETAQDLDYSEALAWFGLRWKMPALTSQKTSLGAITKVEEGRLMIIRIPDGTTAAGSGLNAGDEIIALDDYRVRPEALAERLEQYQPGANISVLVARREKLMRFSLALEAEPHKWELEVSLDTTDEQTAHRTAWLS